MRGGLALALLLVLRLNSRPHDALEALLSRLVLGRGDGLLGVRVAEAAARLAGLELRTHAGADTALVVLVGAALGSAIGVANTSTGDELATGTIAHVLGSGRVADDAAAGSGSLLVVLVLLLILRALLRLLCGLPRLACLLLGRCNRLLSIGVAEATACLAGLELRADARANTALVVLVCAALRCAISVANAPASYELAAGSVADVLGSGWVSDGQGRGGNCIVSVSGSR